MTEEKKDVVPSQYRDQYKATGGTCGDFIGTTLQAICKKDGLDSLNLIKSENGIEADRWATFNPGMQRMNLANVLRGMFLKGETVTILGKAYNAKHRAEDFSGKIEDNDKSLGTLAVFLDLQNNPRTIKSLSRLFFPPAPKGPTAEERAAAKAEKDKVKAEKDKVKAEKAEKAEAAAKAKADKKKAADDAKAQKAAENSKALAA